MLLLLLLLLYQPGRAMWSTSMVASNVVGVPCRRHIAAGGCKYR